MAGVPTNLVGEELVECGPLVAWLVRALYPGGVRVMAASDDGAVGRGGVGGQREQVVAGGADPPSGSWCG
ncbi:hypothetical protein [Mycobacterium sp. 1465703.0]|uniref:hypothetical protein n=1 Tax=Mycobacterium sp. 1465703.0 TaxID=1834078 RepID=UPI0012EA51D3|nr:hypothetical protein [Mycobacterium sp. 1465703.0]